VRRWRTGRCRAHRGARVTLKYNLMFPMRAVKHYERWIGKADLGDVARAAESAGFDAIAMSEHPYPDEKWLAAPRGPAGAPGSPPRVPGRADRAVERASGSGRCRAPCGSPR